MNPTDRFPDEPVLDHLYRVLRIARTYRAKMDAWTAIHAYGATVRAALPFPTTLAHAYNPHEHATSNGATHLVVTADIQIGRWKRNAGDALCKPAARFWGLEGGAGGTAPSCRGCLDRARALINTKGSPSWHKTDQPPV